MYRSKRTFVRAGGVMVACLAAMACTSRGEDPLIHDTTYGSFRISDSIVDVFGTTASRRMVFVRNERKNAEGGKGNFLTFCAEPSPDVGEAFASAIATSLQGTLSVAQGADTQAGATAAGAFARELATQIAPLLYRTQGLQLYRDAQFGLCNDLMSDYISREDYIRLKTHRFMEALELIKLEVPYVAKMQEKSFESLGAGRDKIGAAELLKAVKEAAPADLKPPVLGK